MKITAVANDNGYRFRTIENAKAKGLSVVRLVPVQRTCPLCHKTEVRKYPEDGIKMYQRGALIQDAFPDADASEREWFMTGFCDTRQDIIFAEPDEDLDELDEEDYEFADADPDPDTEFQFLDR